MARSKVSDCSRFVSGLWAALTGQAARFLRWAFSLRQVAEQKVLLLRNGKTVPHCGQVLVFMGGWRGWA
ncbi:hypothetical protein CKO11_13440 [Rhodobacter sp. TJ_12]|nr:hypothetical protein [Rhodobacter sp. TJ_12]